MFKKNFLSVACSAALVGAVAAPAYASTTFHLVVPLTARQQAQQPPVDSIAVSLAGAALRKATVNQAYSESLRPYLVVTGDAAFDPAAARWRLVNGALPTGLALNSFTGQIAGTPSSVTQAGASFDIAATYKGKSAQQTYTLQVAKTSVASCKDYLQANPGAPSGWYTLDVDGTGPATPQSYYCDMTSDGGGWTRIVRQTEAEPVPNWNGGVNGQSYALSTAQIPPHTQTAFGKDEEATYIDYVDWTYSTGNIDPIEVSSSKSGARYLIYRSDSYYYNDHDPRTILVPSPSNVFGTWINSLSLINKDSQLAHAASGWTFSPSNESPAQRGYRMQMIVWSGPESYAWTVWVR